MKLLIVLAVAACAHAFPAPGNEATNASLYASERNFGFAGYGSGTSGGGNGAVWNVFDPWALQDAIKGDSRRNVNVHGFIDLTRLFTKSPGVVLLVGSYKTITGFGATIYGGGLRLRRVQHVIIQNIKFHNALSYAPGEWPNGSGGFISQAPGEFTEVDAVLIETSDKVVIDHNEFADDPWISNNVPNNRMRHDGLLDIKRGSNWITVSNNIFRNHNKNMLLGHSDGNAAQDSGKLKVTYAYNWFQGTKQRNPRVRYARTHILNNLYENMGTYGIGVGAGASVYAERNVFKNSVAWRHPSGTPNPIGNLYNNGNSLISGSRFDAVPSKVSWKPSDYYRYSPLAVGSVEAHVRRNAGPK